MTFLVSVAAFLVAIAVLVTFHELGHYWVARLCGVQVLRFSVGFGRPLWRWVSPRSQTEWVLAMLPLGGYVKMLDRREIENIPESLVPFEFTGKPLYQRAAIIMAGPLFNLLLAFLLYTLVFLGGETGRRAVVGYVEAGTPAAVAGLRTGDELLEVAGQEMRSWQDFLVPLLDSGLGEGLLPMQVQRADGERVWTVLDVGAGLLQHEDVFGTIGMIPMRAHSQPVIGELTPGLSGDAAGLQPGDRILSLDGQSMATWEGAVKYLRARPGQEVAFEIERAGQRLRPGVHVEAIDIKGETLGRVGALPHVDPELEAHLSVHIRYSLGESLWLGAQRTWDFTVLTVRLIGALLTGGASVKNISGPVGIAEFAGTSAMIGLAAFLSLLALLSISLGVLNLLPIPILDGGHLMYCLYEALTGKPVSARIEAVGQRIGLVLLIALMGLALYNDTTRLLLG